MQTRIKTDLSEPLSLEIISQFLKYEDNAVAENALINAMISSVRTILEKRTGLVFAEKEFEILFDYEDAPYIIPVYPFILISELLIIDYTGTEGNALVLNSGYTKAGMYEIELTVPGMIKSSKLKATCKAGYGHKDTETLPVALMDAMKTQIFQWYENRDDFIEGNVLGIIDTVVNLFRRTIE